MALWEHLLNSLRYNTLKTRDLAHFLNYRSSLFRLAEQVLKSKLAKSSANFICLNVEHC